MHSTRFISMVLCVLFQLCALTIARAEDPIAEFMKSKSFAKYQRRSSPHDLTSKKWMKPGTAYTKLFSDSEGGSYLLDWLAVTATGLTAGALDAFKQQEYVGAARTFLTKDLKKVTVTAMAPHPKYKGTIEVGLIERFAQFEPPQLRVVYSRPLEIGGAKGTVYEADNGQCSILFKVERGVIVNLATKTCVDEQLLLDFAQKLDFNRLNERLNS